METEQKCKIAEQIGEFVLGMAVGAVLNNTVLPKCNKFEKAIVVTGAGISSWMLGRTFAKHFYKFCDAAFDTDFSIEIENL